jgi:hypothetical protein
VKQTAQKSSNGRRAAAARSAAGRKKFAVALLLFFVMAVLWVRAFVGRGGPKTASAIGDINAVETADESAALKVIYTELPVDACRRDVLANDFFTARDFKEFGKQGESAQDSEVSMSGAENPQLSGDLAAAVEELELIAIVNDKKPQAFIGDKLLEKGQSLRFVFRDQAYDFKVVNILEDRVELECNGVIITKKIPELLFKTE